MTGQETPKVFWSWQSDTPSKYGRDFIRSALKEAIDAAGKELGLEDAGRPEMDSDTQGVAGMVDIASTIFEKISSTAIFVADITPLAKFNEHKALPNPNVLIELGWALKSLGEKGVIAVMNTYPDYRPEQMPFDIRQKRIISYRLGKSSDPKEKRSIKNRLVQDLTSALTTNLDAHIRDRAKNINISFSPSKAGDRSLWFSIQDVLSMQDEYNRQSIVTISLAQTPRAYIRIKPAGWNNSPPTAQEVSAHRDNLLMWPMSDLSGGGNYGITSEGIVHYWTRNQGKQQDLHVENLWYYMDNQGEMWMLHGVAIHDDGAKQQLRLGATLGGWSAALRNTIRLFMHLGAIPPFKVEVGLSNLSGLELIDERSTKKYIARNCEASFTEQLTRGTLEEQTVFLRRACEEMMRLFAAPKWDELHFQQQLNYWDNKRTPQDTDV